MFEFLGMIGTYDARKVKRDELKDFILDTAFVTDRSWLYETAVAHKKFNSGKWIILGGASTKEEALEIHNKWLEKLKSGVDTLEDCYNGKIYKKRG